LLKYFPGPLEPVGTQVVPGLVAGFLALLPFVDRSPDRHPFRAGRRGFTLAMFAVAAGIVTLAALGFADRPAGRDAGDWGLLPIAGREIATGKGSTCERCHDAGGAAAPLSFTRLTKDEEWLLTHMADPVAIAPGVRFEGDPVPAPVMSRFQAQAVVAFLRRHHAGIEAPPVDATVTSAALTYAETCVRCHKISGDGGTVGPDLTHVGTRRDAASIRDVIDDASMVYGDSVMPVFKGKLSEEQIAALVTYLSARK
jgi:mono/diheme cytochrome c family protein